jgi:serine/threonine protein kinase
MQGWAAYHGVWHVWFILSLIVPGDQEGGSRAGTALDGTRMSTFTSEPGTRLGGRYRLEDRISASGGWSAWKAIDETLARPVTVLTFAPGFPRIREVITAARAASRLTDARLAQVFDVEENYDQAYVVMEWVAGDSLHDMLADGPLDPGQSAEIIAEGAEALASAHAAGVAHLCLTPGSLRWTNGGGVKIAGLGIDAALSGTTADDPALADTTGLGRLLYAALTAHWPGDEWPALPPAPQSPDGRPCSPRQVRAGVPAAVDDICCQALFQNGRGGKPAMTSPAVLADALARVVPAPIAPPPAPRHPSEQDWDDLPPGAATGPYWQLEPEPPRRPVRPDSRSRTAAMLGIGALLVVALIGIGLWILGHRSNTAQGTGGPSQSSSSSPSSAAAVLRPVSAHGFDALSPPSADPGNENDNEAGRAIDSNPSTFWHTQFYLNNPVFGGYKAGTGLILDMGRRVRLSSVKVIFGSVPGANVQIKLGNDNTRSPATLSTFTTVASATNVAGAHTFTVTSHATGRYVLIWFTKLPPQAGSSNSFEAQVYNIVVRGSS